MLSAWGAETSGDDAPTAQLGAARNKLDAAAQKSAEAALPSVPGNAADAGAAAGKDTAQAMLARFQLSAGQALSRGETVAVAVDPQQTAASENAHSTSFENSQSSGKAARHENSSEKKQAAGSPAAAGAAFLAMTVPVLPNAVLPNPVLSNPVLPSVGQASVAVKTHAAQSFLSETSSGAGHSAGAGLAVAAQKNAPQGIVPAAGDSRTEAGGVDAATGNEAHLAAEGAADVHSVAAGSPAAATPQAGLQPPGPDSSIATDGASGVSASALNDASGAASASAENPSAAHAVATGDKRVGEPAGQRAAHGATEAGAAALPGHAAAVPPIGPGGDSSALLRDAATGHGAANTAAVGAAGSRAPAPGTHETFTALDTDAANGASWQHTGAHSAEAGFEDPALGWVSVRADLTAGAVHASVLPGTAEAAQTLSAHMAGLSSYLSEHRTPVHTLTLASPGGDSGFSQAAGQNAGQGSGSGGSGDAAGRQPMQVGVAFAQAAAQTSRVGNDVPLITPRTGASIALIA